MSNTTTTPVPTTFNPNVPHCTEWADNHFDPNRQDGPKTGGGYMTCLTELRADGSCPKAHQHRDQVAAWMRAQTTCSPGHHLGTCTCGATTPVPVGLDETELSILVSTNMTACVQTRSGSRYTVVTRPEVGVVLIHDSKGWAIRAGKGSRVAVIQGRMFVMGANGKVVARTTSLTGIYIMSN